MCDVKMHDAVVKRDVHALRDAIDEGADVNASKGPGSNGETPLMIAARQGSLDVCKALVDARADVHLQSGTGWTALDLARALDQPAIVAFLEGAIKRSRASRVHDSVMVRKMEQQRTRFACAHLRHAASCATLSDGRLPCTGPNR